MVKLLKLCLSLVVPFMAISLSSCSNNPIVEEAVEVTKSGEYSKVLEKEENEFYENGIGRGYGQGSEKQLAFLDTVTQKYPNYSHGWYERGVWELKSGNIIEYFKYMNKATAMDPAEHLGWRANIKMRFLRDYEGALKDYYDFLELMKAEDFPARAESSRYSMGKIYYQLGEYEKAIENLDISINLISEDIGEDWVDVYTFYFRGLAYLKLENYDKAIRNFDLATKYYEECSEAYYYKALTYFKMEKFSEASDVLALAKINYQKGYYRDEAYIEDFAPVFMYDIEELEQDLKLKS